MSKFNVAGKTLLLRDIIEKIASTLPAAPRRCPMHDLVELTYKLCLNNLEIASERIEELSKIEFISEKNESLKNAIISSILEGIDKSSISTKINSSYKNIIEEINENSNIQIIVQNKSEQEILDLIEDLIQDHKDQSSLKKIESLEKKLINNLDENSYSELIKLKSQLNRD